MLEAMSTGCTIIASNTAPVTEYMQDNYNGILVDFNDINAIVKNASEIINNKDKYKEISKNARKTIVDKCKLKDMLEKQINLINTTLKKA